MVDHPEKNELETGDPVIPQAMRLAAGRDVLMKADRQEPLVVVRVSMAAALVAQIGTETKQ